MFWRVFERLCKTTHRETLRMPEDKASNANVSQTKEKRAHSGWVEGGCKLLPSLSGGETVCVFFVVYMRVSEQAEHVCAKSLAYNADCTCELVCKKRQCWTLQPLLVSA